MSMIIASPGASSSLRLGVRLARCRRPCRSSSQPGCRGTGCFRHDCRTARGYSPIDVRHTVYRGDRLALADLNQLRTFVVLYELRSLTATAERLHVTQPTVSYTLGRLRQRLGDDLFRREGHVMVPTARATQLFGPLHEALTQIDAVVSDPDAFDPTTFRGELTLGLTSIGEQTFLPPIIAALARESSDVHVKVERLDADQVEDRLVRGAIDLAITVSLMGTPRLWRTRVRSVEYVALSSRAHALAPSGPRMFAGRRFVRVSARGGHVFPVETLVEH